LDPTGDCPGETEFPPGGVLCLSGGPPPRHEDRPHLVGGWVNGVIWGCQEARQLQNCSLLPQMRCSRNALPEQFLRIGCRRCSRNELDCHWSGCPLLLQTGVGTGQARSRRRRRWGRTSWGRRRRTRTSWGMPGQTRPNQRRRSRLAGGCNRDPPCLDLHDPLWRCSTASQEDLREGAARRCTGGSHSGAWRRSCEQAGDVQGTISLLHQPLP